MAKVIVVDQALLDELSAQARQLPRKRKNFNFHSSNEAQCHRILNAVEPDSYIQPHCHLNKHKDETAAVIRGRMGFVFFDDAGRIQGSAVLGPGEAASVIDFPCGVFHTCISLKPGSVFFEAKAGPFIPITPEERAQWAPMEGTETANAYLAQLRKLFETQ